MRYVLTRDLENGMVIGKPIYNMNGCALLREGASITPSNIRQLTNRGIAGVYVDENYVERSKPVASKRTPIKIEPKQIVDPKLRVEARREVKRVFQNTVENRQKYSVLDTSNKLDTKSATEIVHKIISNIIKNENVVVNMVDVKAVDEDIFSHSVNVAILSLIVGASMNLSTDELYSLGMAAILHDVPKVELPSELRNKEKTKSMDTKDKIQAKILVQQACLSLQGQDLSEDITDLVIEHNKRTYQHNQLPLSEIDDNTSIMAEIIGLCDVYDELISNKTYAMLPSDAMEFIMGHSGVLFSLNVVRAFVYKVAIYPLGTPVRLSTGELAIVVNNYIGRTSRPVVKIVAINEVVNLFHTPNLSVTIIETYDIDKIKESQNKKIC